ncbi:hypothetical protein GBA52_025955 [Prunus armeniaca]|nr:hypothetical protein GBA52_025955 [Prunus armeniaca]
MENVRSSTAPEHSCLIRSAPYEFRSGTKDLTTQFQKREQYLIDDVAATEQYLTADSTRAIEST